MQYDLFDRTETGEKPESDTSTDRQTNNSSAGCYWDFCPNCSARLHNAGCKYRCARCHYFMSCSDFD